MNNISDINNCYGCGVCATACTKSIIKIMLNEDGFYEPVITDIDKCTNCGLCRNVCAYLHDDLSLKTRTIVAYAGWSKDHAVRRTCSSGGVGFEIGRTLLTEGYKACGVRYNVERRRAEHYIAGNTEELIPSIGSKYIQSYTTDAFKAIDKKQKYLVTGTPCQIDSFRRYLQVFKKEDNFVLLDFFCHGVPSMLMWQKYLESVEKKIGKATYVTWRNKHDYGWHDSWLMGIDSSSNPKVTTSSIKEKRTQFESRWTKGDIFYQLFLENVCLGKACYNKCKYKYNNSAADIRIGDAWGTIYRNDKDGVSVAIAFTPKGEETLLKTNCVFHKHTFEEIAEGQVKHRLLPAPQQKMVMKNLKDKQMTIEEVFIRLRRDQKLRRIIRIICNPSNALQKFIKRLKKQ